MAGIIAIKWLHGAWPFLIVGILIIGWVLIKQNLNKVWHKIPFTLGIVLLVIGCFIGLRSIKASHTCPECGSLLTFKGECLVCNKTNSETKPTKETCTSCGYQLPGGAKFCPSCGNTQPEHCPSCGLEVKDDYSYCPECGQDLGGTYSD